MDVGCIPLGIHGYISCSQTSHNSTCLHVRHINNVLVLCEDKTLPRTHINVNVSTLVCVSKERVRISEMMVYNKPVYFPTCLYLYLLIKFPS